MTRRRRWPIDSHKWFVLEVDFICTESQFDESVVFFLEGATCYLWPMVIGQVYFLLDGTNLSSLEAKLTCFTTLLHL